MLLNLLWGLVGLLFGGLVNVLADDLPNRAGLRRPHCHRCGYDYEPARWLALSHRLQGGVCPNCGIQGRRRPAWVEVATAALFFALPWLIQSPVDLVIKSFYILVLILIVVTDIEHRLIFHVVTIPTTLIALLASWPLENNAILLALVGAAFGFVLFFLAYQLGARLFGPGALGFGDVTLATMMGAMLGLEIIFTLVLGILLAGLFSLAGLLTGRLNRRSYFAYGPFLAASGIIMVIWGSQLLDWYMAR